MDFATFTTTKCLGSAPKALQWSSHSVLSQSKHYFFEIKKIISKADLWAVNSSGLSFVLNNDSFPPRICTPFLHSYSSHIWIIYVEFTSSKMVFKALDSAAQMLPSSYFSRSLLTSVSRWKVSRSCQYLGICYWWPLSGNILYVQFTNFPLKFVHTTAFN